VSDGEVDDEGGETRASKRRRLNEEAILKRRERRLWDEKRSKLLFDYSQFTYYAKAVCVPPFFVS
jgi:cell division control protein 45